MAKKKQPKNVPSMDHRQHLFGTANRNALNNRDLDGKVRFGDQLAAENADMRGLFYFQPERARRLRQATNKALGRRLGGTE